MFGFISKKKLKDYMNTIKSANRSTSFNVNYDHPISKEQRALNAYAQGYEDGTDNFFNGICFAFGIKRNGG